MTWFDYDGDDGTTIRFGDGVFGASAAPGTVSPSSTVGGGRPATCRPTRSRPSRPGRPRGRRSSPARTRFRPPAAPTRRPSRRYAPRPQQFRASRCAWSGRGLRGRGAVAALGAAGGHHVPLDGELADRLTTADPAASEQRHRRSWTTLTDLLNRRRLAGYESYVLSPRYVSVDLRVTVLARARPSAGTWRRPCSPAAARHAARRAAGLLRPHRWRFGPPLQRSALLAAVQACPASSGVSSPVPRCAASRAGRRCRTR